MEEPLMKIPVWERMTRFNERSVLGRVVVNPPGRMAQLIPHPTGEEWFFCKPCGFACLTREKMIAHKEKHLQHETSEEQEEEEDDGETRVIGNGNESDEDVALEFQDDIINKKRDHYQCGVCRKVLVSLKGLRNHHLVHQNQRREKCKICGATFKKKQYCVRHIKKSHDPSYQNCCKFCPCRFETERGLQSHLTFYHDVNLIGNKIDPIQPTKVEEITETPELSKKAYGIKRSASVPRKYKHSSIKIKLSFSSKYSVQNRIDRSIVLKAIHHNTKNFDCHICKRTYSSRVTLRNHMFIHTGEKPLTCNKCAASFRWSSALVKHVKRNHGDGAFSCYYCPCKLTADWLRRIHCFRYHPHEVNPDTNTKFEVGFQLDQEDSKWNQ